MYTTSVCKHILSLKCHLLNRIKYKKDTAGISRLYISNHHLFLVPLIYRLFIIITQTKTLTLGANLDSLANDMN